MKSLLLSDGDWQLCGWRPHAWRLGRSMELGFALHPDISPIPAEVPGSVQEALRKAGALPEWNLGLNSLSGEWVAHRHWEFSSLITLPGGFSRIILEAEMLDHSGWILVDGRVAAEFRGALLRQQIDLTKHLLPGRTQIVSLVFDGPPDEQGQIGFTSQTRHFKPRFAYGWDWCPRHVPVGIGGPLRLVMDPPDFVVLSVASRMEGEQGWVDIRHTSSVSSRIRVTRTDPYGTATPGIVAIEAGAEITCVPVRNPLRWWPNGEGDQPLYRVEIFSIEGEELWQGQVGFKSVRWLPCEGAPDDAEPWLCEVNGRAVFLQGVNWTPARLDYLSTTAADLETLMMLYREMGCKLLRVWGGAFLECERFYKLADEFGLMVWQEFPLSSSGIENWPPEDPSTIAKLEDIATDYVRRRSHHASVLLWCGGNELQGGPNSKIGIGRPCSASHPCLAALAAVVAREMPGVRYLPTSSSGPRFTAEEVDFGKGLHHDVHGPWNLNGAWENWEKYWANDDALFRSEAGFPGTMKPEQIRHYADGLRDFPPDETNLYWMHTGAWWRQQKDFAALAPDSPQTLEAYCAWSRDLQARALAVAAGACKSRFPRCGGFVVWMGHDCFPCPANTAIIDFERKPKPAYEALKAVFLRPTPP